MVLEVSYVEMTPNGLLREVVYLGEREDSRRVKSDGQDRRVSGLYRSGYMWALIASSRAITSESVIFVNLGTSTPLTVAGL
jgi:hypothetical protein